MCGRSPTGGEEVLAADHEAPEHVAEDSSLVFRERVHEHCNTDLCGLARLRDFARFAGAKQCPPRDRYGHLGRTAVRDTPTLDVPANYPPAMRLHGGPPTARSVSRRSYRLWTGTDSVEQVGHGAVATEARARIRRRVNVRSTFSTTTPARCGNSAANPSTASTTVHKRQNETAQNRTSSREMGQNQISAGVDRWR
jgi:hypothetical protein